MSEGKEAIRVEFEPGRRRALVLCRDGLFEYALLEPFEMPNATFVASLRFEFEARDFRVNWLEGTIEVMDVNGAWHLWVYGEGLTSAQKFSCIA